MKTNSYKKSGVDIEAGYEVVNRIKKIAKKQVRGVFKNNIGMFAGAFDFSHLKIKNPILLSSTDGVGTKLMIALNHNRLENIGQDLVAMCVNDLICHGAKPLFFLDYIGTHKVNPDQIEIIIKSIVESLDPIDCALLGGETAEMSDMYKPGDLDLAGMATGICNKKKLILGSKIKPGNIIIALESSGIHSNGYSLVRKVLKPEHYHEQLGGRNILDIVMEPTKIYVNPILDLIEKVDVLGLANNTGGGIIENLPRCFPDNISANIKEELINVPSIFQFIEKEGNVDHKEMFNIFNMGMGFFVVVNKKDVEKTLKILSFHNVKACQIGETITGNKTINILWK
ncbi:MAG: phosphoribosylformylglycinamidine cyclo-ligase [Mycoplasma sp.]